MKNLSQFNDVENRTLRAWNRFAVFFNLLGSAGPDPALAYMRGFPKADKADLLRMMNDMKRLGYDEMKAAVNRGAYDVSRVCVPV